MCSLAKKNEICLGDRIIDHCKLPMRKAGFKTVKGFEHKVEVRKILLQKNTKPTLGATAKMQTKSSKRVA